ncbi:MAG: ABC transporter permease [Clostridia bacterium]|nr:ABC transporter permease [Clostridia bacterium]
MLIKFAFRNLRRLPWRTVLYSSAVFLVILAMTASLLVLCACENARTTLEEEYMFVASLVHRPNTNVYMSDVGLCTQGNEILGINLAMAEGQAVIPGGVHMTEYPDEDNMPSEPSALYMEPFGCNLFAVENLSMVYPFFTGEYTIREGTGLTAEGYTGERAELVIPWWLADQYGIGVGDTVMRRYNHYGHNNNGHYSYRECTVVGIYEAKNKSASPDSYPAYMTVGRAERDYDNFFIPRTVTPIVLDRVDFVLRGRDSFGTFVKTAEANGLALDRVDLVFNNATYDTLLAELDSIRTVALFVFLTVLTVGLGVLIFFTVLLCHTRERERRLLVSLGMTRGGVCRMLAWELAVMLLVAVTLGLGVGYLAAEGVCSYVNGSVLARASASQRVRNLSSDEAFDETMPLEKRIELSVSVFDTTVSASALYFNSMCLPDENELGISRLTLPFIETGENGYPREGIENGVWHPTTIVAVTDPDAVGVSVSTEALRARADYNPYSIYMYVSESSPFAPKDGDDGLLRLYFGKDMQGCVSVVDDFAIRLGGEPLVRYGRENVAGIVAAYVIGTYRDNALCSGEDVLICMEDYHDMFEALSVDFGGFRFERIGHIINKEELQ